MRANGVKQSDCQIQILSIQWRAISPNAKITRYGMLAIASTASWHLHKSPWWHDEVRYSHYFIPTIDMNL